MKQEEAVIVTLEKLGGIATLGQLNQEVFKIEECVWKTKTPFASVRRIVQTSSEIYKIRPGLYALEKFRKRLEVEGIVIETSRNKDSKEIISFNHSYYQGLIVSIGNLLGLSTFVPNQDKNRRFINKRMNEIVTLNKIPGFTYPSFIKRTSSIDVIWFNKRQMPKNFLKLSIQLI